MPIPPLYLARHCDVENPGHILYGHLPGFALSKKGVAQAHALGRLLATKGIKRIYCSPLLRTRQTAEIIASYIPGVTVDDDPDLIEAKFSLHIQGIPHAMVPWERPLWFIHFLFPGLLPIDESVAAMAERVGRPLQKLRQEFPDHSALCVSHGDPIASYWVRNYKLPRWAIHRWQCAKGGILQLDYADATTVNKITYFSPERVARLAPEPRPGASAVPTAGADKAS